MIRSVIPILIALTLTGCESEQERQVREMEEHVNATVRIDWQEGLPLDDLYKAYGECNGHPVFEACRDLRRELEDIAATLISCKQDQRSKLCQGFVRVIGKHKLARVLPAAEPVRLPDFPFYWSMPTLALESLAPALGYRRETLSWWWEAWRWHIISCLALLVGVPATWSGWSWWRRKKDEQEYENILRQEAAAERKRIRKEAEERVRVETARRLQKEREEELAEQQLKAERQEAERLAAEETARRAAEQAEEEAMVKAAFTKSKRARKKNVSSIKK